ncbi:hypothetical protein [Nonomuraea sp. NPDC005650]|uniref:hypothetical protein n=1 Tax=Nonomuraea sp. NPDC005650 TaxID=3157045 RepID=UPI0033A6E80D
MLGASHGPYRDLATCNYWMYGVRAGGRATTDCYYYNPPITCPGGVCHPDPRGW